MSDATIVTVTNPFNNLLENTLCFFLIKTPILLCLEIAVETATSNILHNQDHILGSINDLVKSDDVLIAHFLHEFDLALHALPSVWV